MSRMSVTFLGTSSGGGPNDTRSCSSLALELFGDGVLWLVDCAEGTLRQFALQPHRPTAQSRLRTDRVAKIFITHLHFDHTMGIITLLANILRGGAGTPQPPRTKPPVIELYGPAGLRKFVRSIMTMTSTELTDRYVVHELLTPTDPRTSCDLLDLHDGESPGRDIISVSTGLWFDFAIHGNIHVDAGPLIHRVHCLGYVFRELGETGRKIVVLGDTCDPSALTELAQNATLLIHEATDAHIPVQIDRALRGDRKSPALIQQKTIAKGHSTPGMAGNFAKTIRASQLILNHFSGKFPAPWPNRKDRRRAVMQEIERQASEAWGLGKAIAAYDFYCYEIPRPPQNQLQGSAPQSRFKEPSFDTPMSRQIPLPRIHEGVVTQASSSRPHTVNVQAHVIDLTQNSSQSRKVLKRRKTSG